MGEGIRGLASRASETGVRIPAPLLPRKAAWGNLLGPCRSSFPICKMGDNHKTHDPPPIRTDMRVKSANVFKELKPWVMHFKLSGKRETLKICLENCRNLKFSLRSKKDQLATYLS